MSGRISHDHGAECRLNRACECVCACRRIEANLHTANAGHEGHAENRLLQEQGKYLLLSRRSRLAEPLLKQRDSSGEVDPEFSLKQQEGGLDDQDHGLQVSKKRSAAISLEWIKILIYTPNGY